MQQKNYPLKWFAALVILFSVTTLSVAQKTFNYSQGPNHNDWANANNWTPSGVPTSSDNVIIPGNPSYTARVFNNNITAVCNNLTVTGGDFAVDGFLTVSGNVVMGPSSGNFFVFNNGTSPGGVSIDGNVTNGGSGKMVLIQDNNNTNAGYRHWGSIVNNGTLNDLDLSTNGFTVQGGNGLDCFYSYSPYPNVQRFNPATAGPGINWNHGFISFTNPSAIMDNGKGYAFRLDAPGTLGANFVSTPGAIWNSGFISPPSLPGPSGWDLFANPYPGTLDLQQFINFNPVSSAYLFHANGQFSGTWGTVDGAGVTTGGASIYAAPGQGFFLQNGGAPITFGNTMLTGNASQLYKTNTVSNLVRINLSNGTDWNDMVAYTGTDANYAGSEAFAAASNLNAYFSKNSKYYVINNLSDITAQTEMPVSFMVNAAGTYTVALTENQTNGLSVYLKDNQTNTYTNLSSGSASITLPANTTVDGRYSITFKAEATGIANTLSNTNVYMFNHVLYVNRDNATNASVEVTDVLGRLLARYNIANTNEAIDLSYLSTSGYLMVKVTEGKNSTVAKVVMN
ncbi:MAG: T9SS type A sorting domain-containing protein [Chitinophagales bacterium]